MNLSYRCFTFALLLSSGLAAQQRRDVMAAIALEPPPTSRPQMAEKTPPALPAIELESAHGNPGVTLPSRQVMRTREQFQTGLAELRQRYAPFLENRTPAAAATRDRMALDEFDFRMEEAADLKDIARVWRGEGSWSRVRIPDYRGPVGWWAGYYRKVFRVPEKVAAQPSIFLRFNGVDYRCQVYLNGRMIGTHTGFFAPFEMDATPYLRKDADNVLVVRVENESIMLGLESWSATQVDGEKIYAAAGPGWDDPVLGWHACPPGAGIWQKVWLEGRPATAVTDLFVRPDLKNASIEVRVEVQQSETANREVELTLAVYPRNFSGAPIENIVVKAQPAGPGFTEYRTRVRLGDFRAWTPDEPWLYTLRATLRRKTGGADIAEAQFGMREFAMDDTSAVKGTLYLNGRPVILRGANTMGHFETAVMRGDTKQLMDDILIGKMAHMNYFRLTQSPVQPEVYEMCDRLGMMLQTDLPLFGYLRRPQFEEAVRQVGEMEKLVRNHASNIMITYINEPFSTDRQQKTHRDLTRAELELFFTAASAVAHSYNPDRVVKPVDGDYDPPAPGLPDNHIYSTWYGSHAVPIGKFMRGYWVANKDGWKFGSGEYGTEGLENAATMFRHYPKEWLPRSVDDPWTPEKIPYAQAWTMHDAWYDTPDTMREWIAVSQAHQAWGVGEMTRAFRRQSDRIVSTAVHLLIDAWPSGWMKTLVDADREPKPAYFAFRDALTPLLADIRTDRLRYFGGEPLALEFWLCNDYAAPSYQGELAWEVWRGNQRVFAQSAPARIPAYGAAFQGYFRYRAPLVSKREKLTIRLGLKDASGNVVHDSTKQVEIFPAFDKSRNAGVTAAIVGRRDGRAWKLARTLGLQPRSITAGGPAKLVLVDQADAWEMARESVLKLVREGSTALFLEQEPGTIWRMAEGDVEVKKVRGREFISRKTGSALVGSFEPFDFSYWYDREKDYIEYVATTTLEGEGLKTILRTGDTARPGDPKPGRHLMPVAAERTVGKGRLVFSQVKATARVEYEPVAAAYYQAIIAAATATP